MHMRLLLAGLFGALFLVKCTSPAHAGGIEASRVLHIEVYTADRRHAYEAWLPYPTNYTCIAAGAKLDLKQIERLVAFKQHIKVAGSSHECVAAGAII